MIKSDFFIHPPTLGVFDIAVLEAMSAGFPIIAIKIKSHIEMLGEGNLLISNEEDGANILMELIDNIDLRTNFGKLNRKRFEDNFTLNKMVNSYFYIKNLTH